MIFSKLIDIKKLTQISITFLFLLCWVNNHIITKPLGEKIMNYELNKISAQYFHISPQAHPSRPAQSHYPY